MALENVCGIEQNLKKEKGKQTKGCSKSYVWRWIKDKFCRLQSAMNSATAVAQIQLKP